MDIRFSDRAPRYEFDRDSLSFGAVVDDKPVLCLVTFDALGGPSCNDVDTAMEAFAQKRTAIEARATALIEQGKAKDGTLLIRNG